MNKESPTVLLHCSQLRKGSLRFLNAALIFPWRFLALGGGVMARGGTCPRTASRDTPVQPRGIDPGTPRLVRVAATLGWYFTRRASAISSELHRFFHCHMNKESPTRAALLQSARLGSDGRAPRTARSISSGALLCRAVVPNDRLTGPPVVRALTALRLSASRGGSSEGEKRSLQNS